MREFYAALEGPVVVGIEATGAMQWFLELLEELGIECRVGHPAKIRAQETRKQKQIDYEEFGEQRVTRCQETCVQIYKNQKPNSLDTSDVVRDVVNAL